MAEAESSASNEAFEPKAEDANMSINIKVKKPPSVSWHEPLCGSLMYFSQVATQSGEEVFFKIKRNTKMNKLQAAYANKVGKDVSSIR